MPVFFYSGTWSYLHVLYYKLGAYSMADLISAADIWRAPFPLIARGFSAPLVHAAGACLEVEEQQHRRVEAAAMPLATSSCALN